MEKREYYRVEDVLPIIIKRIGKNAKSLRSKVILGYTAVSPDEEDMPDSETVDPKLWRMLVDINNKLNLILEKFNLEMDELNAAETRKINLSEGGIGFEFDEKCELNDIFEIKLLLTSYPFRGLLLYGEVKRVKQIEKGKFYLSIEFLHLESDVEKLLFQYIMHRQKENIRKKTNKF